VSVIPEAVGVHSRKRMARPSMRSPLRRGSGSWSSSLTASTASVTSAMRSRPTSPARSIP
jgi:hypothetical protein